MGDQVGRRAVLGGIVGSGLLLVVPRSRLLTELASAAAPGRPGRFLAAGELATLRAVTARLLPGPPEDPDPGALEAQCAEAIDALLGAFTFDPPLIHAGGPFSGRAGGGRDDMAAFVPLDRISELGWRIRLEGTAGRPERLFAGPVEGLQQTYRKGLADLDRRAGAGGFARATATTQDAVLRSAPVADFVSAVLGDSLAAMYGPPEYMGNHGGAGWRGARWPGDVQPRGWTDEQVSTVDPGAPRAAFDAATARDLLRTMLPGVEGVR